MLSFNEYLTEGYDNFFMEDKQKREKYAQQVWDVIQRSYEDKGGIHGNGFKSIQDMIANIPFWKIYRQDDVVRAVLLYKDSNGRKSVASGTDGSRAGILAMAKMIKDDATLDRTYSEVSSQALFMTIKQVGAKIIDYIVPIDQAIKKMTKDVLFTDTKYKKEFIDDFDKNIKLFRKIDDEDIAKIRSALYDNCYAREIGGGHIHPKVMIGNANSLPIRKS